MAWATGAWAALAWASGTWGEPTACAWNHGSWAEGAWAEGAWVCGESPPVDPPVETPAEQPTGGWGVAFAREQRRIKEDDERRRREREAEERAELAREIAALEQHLEDEGVTLETKSVSRETELARLRLLAERLQAPSNRTLRALAYAERARTEAAIALAMREMQKALEEEELAILLVLAMDS